MPLSAEKQRLYNLSERGKARTQRYKNSETGKAATAQYKKSELGKAARKRYRAGEAGKSTHCKDARLWRQKYPEKAKAHRMVHEAIRKGLMTRKPCIICGEKLSHAHHIDYSKPYDVTWLCHVHHMIEHKPETEGN